MEGACHDEGKEKREKNTVICLVLPLSLTLPPSLSQRPPVPHTQRQPLLSLLPLCDRRGERCPYKRTSSSILPNFSLFSPSVCSLSALPTAQCQRAAKGHWRPTQRRPQTPGSATQRFWSEADIGNASLSFSPFLSLSSSFSGALACAAGPAQPAYPFSLRRRLCLLPLRLCLLRNSLARPIDRHCLATDRPTLLPRSARRHGRCGKARAGRGTLQASRHCRASVSARARPLPSRAVGVVAAGGAGAHDRIAPLPRARC